MSHSIIQLCANIRQKLAHIEAGLTHFSNRSGGKADLAELEIRSHLNTIRLRVIQGRVGVVAARTEMQAWTDEQKATASDTVTRWKAARDVARLRDRADRAERNAKATLEIALAALDNAEQAAFEAWLARHAADSVQPEGALKLVR